MSLVETIALVATVITFVSFLSGLSICLSIYRKGSTHDFTAVPFMAGVLCYLIFYMIPLVDCIDGHYQQNSSTLWLRYGYMLTDGTMIFVNIIGLIFQLSYLLWFYAFTKKRSQLNRQIISLLLTLVLGYLVIELRSEAIYWTGLLACVSSLVCCSAPLVVIPAVIKTKSTEKLPFPLIISSFCVTIMWFLYGLAITDQFVSVTNGIGALINVLQLLLFVIYPNSSKTHKE